MPLGSYNRSGVTSKGRSEMASDESQTRRDQSDQPSKEDDLPLKTDAGAVPFED